jgi:hypothetical protein
MLVPPCHVISGKADVFPFWPSETIPGGLSFCCGSARGPIASPRVCDGAQSEQVAVVSASSAFTSKK